MPRDEAPISALFHELRRRRVFRTAGLYLVVSWVVVEVSTTVFPLIGLPEWAPRVVLGLLAVGFPAVLWAAWAYDLGRGGLARAEAAAEPSAPVRIGQGLLLVGATVAGLGLAGVVLLRTGDGPAPGTKGASPAAPATLLPRELAEAGPERSVLVLPFRNLSADSADLYFAQGIREQIVSELAAFPDILVITGAGTVAAYELDGSVRRSGDSVRIAARLTRSESGALSWSQEFDRDLTVSDIFGVQGEVATAVAGALQSRVSPRQSAPRELPTRSLQAFDHFLRGNHELRRRTPASVTRAIAEYRTASALDPGFAAALTREAYANALFVDWGWSVPGGSPTALLERGLTLADSVLARDSASAEAWLARAYLLVQRDPYRLEGAIPAFQRAISLDPVHAEAYHQYGQSLMVLGRWGEANAAYHSALALEPDRAITLVPVSALALRQGDVDEALFWADSAVAVGPDVPYARAVRSVTRRSAGDLEGARDDADAALRIDPSYQVPSRSALAAALFALGDSAAARLEIERARGAVVDPDRPGPTDALYLGGALVALGRIDDALDVLERARPRSAWLWFYLQSPEFDRIREHPRFQAVSEAADPRS